MEPNELPKGAIVTLCTSGGVMPEFTEALSALRSYNDEAGIQAAYHVVRAPHVESGRDQAVQIALQGGAEWVLQIDADAAPFAPNSAHRLLAALYMPGQPFQAIGAYCQLKQPPHLPTIDTGTGTWEMQHAGQGLLPVIRTGGHFFVTLAKVFQHIPPPWFRTRIPLTPIQAFNELDNFSRTKFDGENPLAQYEEYHALRDLAVQHTIQPNQAVGKVGEDSAFFDLLHAAGMKAAVDTNVVVGHTVTKQILPQHMVEEFDRVHNRLQATLGVIT